MLDSTPGPLSQDATPLFTIRSQHGIEQRSGETSSQETADGESNQSSDNEKESNEEPVAQQTHGH